jgi:transposase
MSGFIVGADRNQTTLLPESLDDYVAEESAVRVIDVFVDELDLAALGFETVAADTGRPGYHPATMLKLFIYGYMNRVQSSHRLEREAQRNVELMWLTQRLAPDFKTIADFRRDNGRAIRKVCREFVVLCRKLGAEQSGSQLHEGEAQTAAGADRREHCAVSVGDGEPGSAGSADRCREEPAPGREDRDLEGGDRQAKKT